MRSLNLCFAGIVEAPYSAQGLDRRALLQKLQAGGDDFVTRLETADHGIGVVDRIAEFDGHLMGDVTITLWRSEKNKRLAANQADREDRNNRRGFSAPDDPRPDKLLVAKHLGAAGNLRLGENALEAVVDLRREETDLRFDHRVAGAIEDLYLQALANQPGAL